MPDKLLLPQQQNEVIEGKDQDEFELCFEAKPEIKLSNFLLWQHPVCDMINSTCFQD